MKIAIDAMGGDHAPKAVVLGAMKAIKEYSDLHITLVGEEEEIRQYLTSEERITILHTDEKIESTDEPVRAVRRKKTSFNGTCGATSERRCSGCLYISW